MLRGEEALGVVHRHTVADQAADGDEERAAALEEACKDCTALCFAQVLCTQRSLNDRLIGAPVEHIVDDHAGKEHRPWNHRRHCVGRIDGVELFCRYDRDQIAQTGEEVVIAEQQQTEDRDHKAADDQSDAVDGIRYRNRLQAAEDGVAGADDTDGNSCDDNTLHLRYAHALINFEDLVEHQCARIQNGRQVGEQVAEQEHDGNDTLGCAVVAVFEEFRYGSQSHLEIARQKYQRQNDKCCC